MLKIQEQKEMTGQRFPQIGVGAVVFKNGKVLLVKRKHPPAKDQWSVPGGKLKFGERLRTACEREIFEETGIKVKAGEIVYTFEVIDRDEKGDIRFHYVILDFEAEYLSGNPIAGDDAAEAGWFDRQEIKSLDINPFTQKLLKEKLNFY